MMHFKARVEHLTGAGVSLWAESGSQWILRASSPLKTKANPVIKVRSPFRTPKLNTGT